MIRTPLLAALAVGTTLACGPRDRQNSALCGLTLMAGANRVLDQMANSFALLPEPPAELREGPVPTRVVGYATSQSELVETDSATVELGYQGEGFPSFPGFAVALVDDSSEVFRGIMVFETDPPPYNAIGTVSANGVNLPLYALRVNWSSVNSDECPIFYQADSRPE